MTSPRTLPAPPTTSQVTLVASRWGTPCTAASGTLTTRPTSITQATTENGSRSFAERDEHIVDTAKASAAPVPPRIASIARSHNSRPRVDAVRPPASGVDDQPVQRSEDAAHASRDRRQLDD